MLMLAPAGFGRQSDLGNLTAMPVDSDNPKTTRSNSSPQTLEAASWMAYSGRTGSRAVPGVFRSVHETVTYNWNSYFRFAIPSQQLRTPDNS